METKKLFLFITAFSASFILADNSKSDGWFVAALKKLAINKKNQPLKKDSIDVQVRNIVQQHKSVKNFLKKEEKRKYREIITPFKQNSKGKTFDEIINKCKRFVDFIYPSVDTPKAKVKFIPRSNNLTDEEKASIDRNLQKWFNDAGIKRRLKVNYYLSGENIANNSNIFRIQLMHDEDESHVESAFKHEMVHYKFVDGIEHGVAQLYHGAGEATVKLEDIQKLNHFHEFRADQYMARKNIHNSRIIEQDLKKILKENPLYGIATNSHPRLDERIKQLQRIRILQEAEKKYLGDEWYRREYDRAFYKNQARVYRQEDRNIDSINQLQKMNLFE
jgi:hypothetical protein